MNKCSSFFRKHAEVIIDGMKVKVDVKVILDINGIHIEYSCRNKKCIFFDAKQIYNEAIEENDKCYHKDGIEIIILQKQSIVHKMFTFAKKDGVCSVVMYSDNTGRVLEEMPQGIECYKEILNDYFLLRVDIRLNDSEIEDDNTVVFNVVALLSNPDTQMQQEMCVLFDKGKGMWDFSDIGAIINEKRTLNDMNTY